MRDEGLVDMKKPSYIIKKTSLEEIRKLCEKYHGYKGAGGSATYCFGVYENSEIVAGYAWQPPPGAAKSVCPEAPQGVLALSRMVAVPKDERQLNHISKPLRRQMKRLIDRTRWPVLVTYSDEGQGHTGHVYKCSGWQSTNRSRVPVKITKDGQRASSYSNGKSGGRDLINAGHTYIQRWEHWICEKGKADVWIASNGWKKMPTGRKWKSGNTAYTYRKPVKRARLKKRI